MNPFSELTSKDFKFVDIPKEISRERYEETKEKIVNHLSDITDIDSVYQLGEISVVGISDLDFLIVLKDDLKDPQGTIRAIKELFKIDPYLIVHYPLILHRKVLPHLHYLFPVFSLKKLFGPDCEFIEPKKKEILQSIMLNDYIDFHWPREFLQHFLVKKLSIKNGHLNIICNEFTRPYHHKYFESLKQRIFPVRTLLCRLNSMKYPLKLIKAAGQEVSKEYETKLQELIRFREQWFKHQNYEKLVEYAKDIVGFCYELIEKNYHIQKKYIQPRGQMRTFIEKNFSKVYLPDWDKEKALMISLKMYRKTGEVVSVLPIHYYVQRRFLDDIMNNKESPMDRLIADDYLAVMKKRYSIYKEHIDFLNHYRFPFKPIIKYDYLKTKPKPYLWYLKWRKKSVKNFLIKNS